jgi:hypothetical protein
MSALTLEQRAYRERLLARSDAKAGGVPLHTRRVVDDEYSESLISSVFIAVKRRLWCIIPQDFSWSLVFDDEPRVSVEFRWKRAPDRLKPRRLEDPDWSILLRLLQEVDWTAERARKPARATREPTREEVLAKAAEKRRQILKRAGLPS